MQATPGSEEEEELQQEVEDIALLLQFMSTALEAGQSFDLIQGVLALTLQLHGPVIRGHARLLACAEGLKATLQKVRHALPVTRHAGSTHTTSMVSLVVAASANDILVMPCPVPCQAVQVQWPGIYAALPSRRDLLHLLPCEVVSTTDNLLGSCRCGARD